MIVFSIEDFEEVTLDRAVYKLLCCFWCVNDDFVIWPPEPQKLKDLFERFTREMERGSHLPFLDMDIYRRPDGCLGHKSHHKPTHTSISLNCGPCLLLSNSQALLSALVHRARALFVIEIAFTMTVLSEGHFEAE
jgi:hypothetical protein